jgi:hypothetical protein
VIACERPKPSGQGSNPCRLATSFYWFIRCVTREFIAIVQSLPPRHEFLLLSNPMMLFRVAGWSHIQHLAIVKIG